MRSRRKGFTNEQKAKVFKRDRALCCVSGKNLWLLDYGAAPSDVDWVDHIRPLSRGGASEIGNAACMSWRYNSVKRDRGGAVHLFEAGRPTEDFFLHFEVLPKEIAFHLRRFKMLDEADWYFNRAIFHVLLGANGVNQRRLDGKPLRRGRDYRARAAWRFLSVWRHLSQGRESLEKRGLVPTPLSHDQRWLLDLRTAGSVRDVNRTIARLVPYVKASYRAVEEIARVKDLAAARALLRWVRSNEFVVPRIKRAIRQNLRSLALQRA